MNRRTFSLRGVIGAIFAPAIAGEAARPSPYPSPAGLLMPTDIGAKMTQAMITPMMPKAFHAYNEYQQLKHKQWMRREYMMETFNRMPVDIDILKLPRQTKINMAVDRAIKRDAIVKEKERSWLDILGLARNDDKEDIKRDWERTYHGNQYRDASTTIGRGHGLL